MFTLDQPTFQLENFEGPLEFLLYLVQKHEIDLEEVPLKAITHQFLRRLHEEELNVDSGAEFVTTTASLLLLKSKRLLPNDQEGDGEILDGDDPRFEIIHQLLDYCRFKEAAKGLSRVEDQQHGVFFRGAPDVEVKKPSGVDHLSVDDLASAFRDLLQRAEHNKGGLIHEEEWRVADKIRWIRQLLKTEDALTLKALFPVDKSRAELIVTFLAILELMKEGSLQIIKEPDSQQILVISGEGSKRSDS